MLHSRRQLAFSLIELTLVIAIIAIISAIAVPRFSGSLDHLRVDHAARRIALDLDYARRNALSSSSTRQVLFDPINHKYELVGVKSLRSDSTAYIIQLAESPYETKFSKIDLNAGNTINFNGYGKPDVGGEIVVGHRGYFKTIVVDPATGRTVIQ